MTTELPGGPFSTVDSPRSSGMNTTTAWSNSRSPA